MFEVKGTLSRSLVFGSVAFLIACGGTEDSTTIPPCPTFDSSYISHSLSNEPEEARIIIDTFDFSDIEAYVVIYSDAGQTIERTIEVDDSGVVDLSYLTDLGREEFSYAVFYLDYDNLKLHAHAHYDVPLGTRYETIVTDSTSTETCNDTVNVKLQISGEIPANWEHSLSGVIRGDFDITTEDELEVCKDSLSVDNLGDLYIKSTNPEDPLNALFGYAIGAVFEEGATIEVQYGIPSRIIPVVVNTDEALDHLGAYASRRWYDFQRVESLNEVSELYLVAPECKVGARFIVDAQRRINSLQTQYVLEYLDDSLDVFQLDFTLGNEPEFRFLEGNVTEWDANGLELDFVAINLKALSYSVRLKSYEINWYIDSSPQLGRAQLPILPDELGWFNGIRYIEYDHVNVGAYIEDYEPDEEGKSYSLEMWYSVIQ